MKTQAILITAASAALLALLAGCPGASEATDEDLVPKVHQLVDALNAGDFDAALALFSDDAHWEFPDKQDFTVERRSFARAWSLDRALGVRLALEECTQQDRTVTCTLIENNDWLALHGLGEWRARNTQFVFDEQGRIRRMIFGERDEELFRDLRIVWIAFESWATKEHPREFEKLMVPGERRLRWTAEAGELLMKLGREWVEAGRPGMDAAREKVEKYLDERRRREKAAGDDETS
ncbi:MAG: hypothetical protein Kow0062_12010 [Acidobacteriota bacterium]